MYDYAWAKYSAMREYQTYDDILCFPQAMLQCNLQPTQHICENVMSGNSVQVQMLQPQYLTT